MQFSLEDQVPYIIQDQALAIVSLSTVFVLFILTSRRQENRE